MKYLPLIAALALAGCGDAIEAALDRPFVATSVTPITMDAQLTEGCKRTALGQTLVMSCE